MQQVLYIRTDYRHTGTGTRYLSHTYVQSRNDFCISHTNLVAGMETALPVPVPGTRSCSFVHHPPTQQKGEGMFDDEDCH